MEPFISKQEVAQSMGGSSVKKKSRQGEALKGKARSRKKEWVTGTNEPKATHKEQ